MHGSACLGKKKTERLGTKKSGGRGMFIERAQSVKIFLTRTEALQRSCIAEEFLNNLGTR